MTISEISQDIKKAGNAEIMQVFMDFVLKLKEL